MSCLFHSFSKFIGKEHFEIRKEICDYLQEDNVLFDNLTISDIAEFEGISKEQYINDMRQHHTWGGAPEIKAFCELYNIGVKVLVIHDNKEIEFIPKTQTKIIKISWNGGHFEPL